MLFEDFEERALKHAVYPDQGRNPMYVGLGCAEEAGEIAGNIKKAMRDDGGVITEERKAKIIKEMGDELWYLAALARIELGVSLAYVGKQLLNKLEGRVERGTLQGEGDDR